MGISSIAGDIGRGLVAGLAGTAAMTVSSTLEARLTGRGASSTPADAVESAFDLEPSTEEAEQRLNSLAHWGYGTGWGAVRGLLGAAGLSGPTATAAHFAAVWGGEQVALPALDVGQPTWAYGAKATATDVLHHAVYSIATGVAYEWLDRS